MGIDKHKMAKEEIMAIGGKFGFIPNDEVRSGGGFIDVVWFSEDKEAICAFEIELREDSKSNMASITKLEDMDSRYKFIVTSGNKLSQIAENSLEKREIMIKDISDLYNWISENIPNEYKKNKELIEKAIEITEEHGEVYYRLGIKMKSGIFHPYPPSTEVFWASIDGNTKIKIPISRLKKGSKVWVNRDTLSLEAKEILPKKINKILKEHYDKIPGFGKRVCEGRKKLDLTQGKLQMELAERGSKITSTSAISSWERGEIMLTRDRDDMKRLADVFEDKNLLEIYENDEVWTARRIIQGVNSATIKMIKKEILPGEISYKKYGKKDKASKRHPETTKITKGTFKDFESEIISNNIFDEIVYISKIPYSPKRDRTTSGIPQEPRLREGIVTANQILKEKAREIEEKIKLEKRAKKREEILHLLSGRYKSPKPKKETLKPIPKPKKEKKIYYKKKTTLIRSGEKKEKNRSSTIFISKKGN